MGNYCELPEITELLKDSHHILIAGATGSGKSTLIDDILLGIGDKGNNALYGIIDLKQVSLMQWENFPRCFRYAINPKEADQLFRDVINEMNKRLSKMREQRKQVYDGMELYLIIDEAAELFDTVKGSKEYVKEITRLGRAAKCFVIMATQSPNRKTLTADILLNFTTRIGLRCTSVIESKQIIGIAGCETLPEYGKCYIKDIKGYITPNVTIDMVDEDERLALWDASGKPYVPIN